MRKAFLDTLDKPEHKPEVIEFVELARVGRFGGGEIEEHLLTGLGHDDLASGNWVTTRPRLRRNETVEVFTKTSELRSTTDHDHAHALVIIA